MSRKFLAFCIVIACLWLFFAVIGPWMTNSIPAWKRFNQIQEEQDLDSGALYYTNVPQTQEAAERTRQAVREGMQIRRDARMRNNGEKMK